MSLPGPFEAAPATHVPEIALYMRQGCHLCDETRELLDALLADRRARGLPAPGVSERDIDSNPEWHAAYFTTIPVVEIAGRRLELATSLAKLRRLLAETLDHPAGGA